MALYEGVSLYYVGFQHNNKSTEKGARYCKQSLKQSTVLVKSVGKPNFGTNISGLSNLLPMWTAHYSVHIFTH